jgi:hypothetical protein
VRELGRLAWWHALVDRCKVAAIWTLVLLLSAVAAYRIEGWLDKRWHDDELPWPLDELIAPTNGLQTIVQVVPAIVVAIFVFAVGTLFVVAQVVPQARGTRAVEVLRNRHLGWTISPALALTPLTILALVLDPAQAWALALVLLVGAVVYLLASTGFLLSILGEATNPILFAAVLARRHFEAVEQLCAHQEQPPRDPAKPHAEKRDVANDERENGRVGRRRVARRAAKRKAAVEDLYEVVRTLRGWARSAATAGDSRELHVALEGTLDLVLTYRAVPDEARIEVPWDYDHNAESWKTSPLRREKASSTDLDVVKPWGYWVPPPCPRNPRPKESRKGWFPRTPKPWQPEDHGEAPDACAADAADVRAQLARTWVANEVGRSLVRAVEFATTTRTLLDRDRARLLLSLEKAARRFAEPRGQEPGDDGSAGVLVAYLVELGLGARRCSAADVDWHFEPLARLAVLHRYFDTSLKARSPDLVVGSAAAVWKVTEAIAAARVHEHYARKPGATWTGMIDVYDHSVVTAVERTVQDLRKVAEVGEKFTVLVPDPETEPAAKDPAREQGDQAQHAQLAVADPVRSAPAPRTAREIAATEVLEPRDHAAIRPTHPELLSLVQEILGCDPTAWQDTEKPKWMYRGSRRPIPISGRRPIRIPRQPGTPSRPSPQPGRAASGLRPADRSP